MNMKGENMKKLSELIKELAEKPENLELVAEAQQLALAQEQDLAEYIQKVEDLQESNRKLFKMVPLHKDEPEESPEKETPPEEPKISPTEALNNLLESRK